MHKQICTGNNCQVHGVLSSQCFDCSQAVLQRHTAMIAAGMFWEAQGQPCRKDRL